MHYFGIPKRGIDDEVNIDENQCHTLKTEGENIFGADSTLSIKSNAHSN